MVGEGEKDNLSTIVESPRRSVQSGEMISQDR